ADPCQVRAHEKAPSRARPFGGSTELDADDHGGNRQAAHAEYPGDVVHSDVVEIEYGRHGFSKARENEQAQPDPGGGASKLPTNRVGERAAADAPAGEHQRKHPRVTTVRVLTYHPPGGVEFRAQSMERAEKAQPRYRATDCQTSRTDRDRRSAVLQT